MFGRTLTMRYTNGIVATNIVVFDLLGGGSYNVIGFTPGVIASYSWSQSPYNGYIPLIFYSGAVLPPSTLKLNFKSATSGNLTGTAYVNYPFTFGAVLFSGTFTNSP